MWWILAVLLAIIATSLVSIRDGAWLSSAMAQAGSGGAATPGRGVYAFTGQLSAKEYGLFMMDADTGTVWCYQLARGRGDGEFRLQLVAARSWIFDRFLEEFNVAPPTPGEVQLMVRQQRGHGAMGGPGATSPAAPGMAAPAAPAGPTSVGEPEDDTPFVPALPVDPK